ncbi:transaldolase [Vibrio parahaemolyticus]|jgi:hypothetical protein|uniref:Transaldolase n=4 Tax=Vibrio harveyi group TaxID=717610 RepID=A0AAX1XQX7_9VIBR|nr:transaldolase [Vibrio antiquarius]ASZ50080.1 transaldolase [Vibrio parahaemolyticus]AVF61506.1 transaldolase [Vibrio diabolicus]EMD78354.1 transaldolase [Vibrio diabolicus E0666]ESV69876.1 putative transaldolase [Vibrio parahaemolyticus 10296]ESW45662.1 putative transaldolase [Vibrio parahaemolyticus 12310]ETT22786.1 putative transaldolase [Vibrio parahaemolyticus 3256]ETX60682.1 putative transaldolase [Vibrio parahaemolyticus SBR10290]KIS79197.1 transaldolase [Vibrio parahaemolyticus 97
MGLSVIFVITACAFASELANRLIAFNETSAQPTTENFVTEQMQ